MLDKFRKIINQALSENPHWGLLQKAWTTGKFPLESAGPQGPWLGAVLAKLAGFTGGALLAVLPEETEAEALAGDLQLFGVEAVHFPWWGSMLYRGISPQAAIFGRRAEVLARLAGGERLVVTASFRAAAGLLPPPESVKKELTFLKTGGKIDPPALEERLQRQGYLRVPRVSVPGEFALRGEVLDVAPLGAAQAVRVIFAWDNIEEIRLFDPLTQASSITLETLTLHPLREVLWTPETLRALKGNLSEEGLAEVREELETQGHCRGEELFYPLAFEKPASLGDYLGERSVSIFVDHERLEMTQQNMVKEYESLYTQAKEERKAVPPPQKLTISLQDLTAARKRSLIIRSLRKEGDEDVIQLSCESGRSFFGNINYLKEEFTRYSESGYRIFVFTESESQAQRVSYLLRDIPEIEVGAASLSEGFSLPEAGIMAVQENEIFGRRRRAPASLSTAKSVAIDSFVDLEPGNLVVHINYGIGRFLGIKRIKTPGAERDYISLEYAGEETIFIPLEQVNLIQRYIGQEGRSPRLDKIGGSSWEKKKGRVRKSVEDLADRLIKLYARREVIPGHAFPRDDDFQISFEASFPWEETEDQLKAIADVKKDMEASRPMDRLICGDVGYGKTEIALRAAFKAVIGGRQAACLCPTTILTEQHHENFTERFQRFPIQVAMLSRFVPPGEQKRIIKGIEDGDIDVVIGTHRLLSRDIKFKNLGLLIIDEEQRFGVKDKERLKELKTSLDCLTLSATPIPRTLHMSLIKIRDISLLKTPPRNRRPIETFIQSFDADLIARAIRQEVERGGQVFFLHNRVESIEQTTSFLRDLVPEVFIETAHGQMSSRELEEVMHRFIHGAFQVLVSTTIIENGIDIPNVNTIIIDRADIYGISQLYQLRGRVGRSGRLAYAYLLYPGDKALSELAMKRLQVISDFTELGSGFKVAMKDLEVRGAGNLIGQEQSGDVSAVGFDLYLRLLEEAIQKRSEEGSEEDYTEPYLELDYSGFLPDGYIEEETEKMEVYKKIAAVEEDEDLDRLNKELFDRFGPLPEEVLSLLALAEIRIIARKLKVLSLKEHKGLVKVTFGKVALIPIQRVMNLIRGSGGRIKLNPASPDSLLLEAGAVGLQEKSEFIRERLSTLLTE